MEGSREADAKNTADAKGSREADAKNTADAKNFNNGSHCVPDMKVDMIVPISM